VDIRSRDFAGASVAALLSAVLRQQSESRRLNPH